MKTAQGTFSLEEREATSAKDVETQRDVLEVPLHLDVVDRPLGAARECREWHPAMAISPKRWEAACKVPHSAAYDCHGRKAAIADPTLVDGDLALSPLPPASSGSVQPWRAPRARASPWPEEFSTELIAPHQPAPLVVGWAYIHLRAAHEWDPDTAARTILDIVLSGVVSEGAAR